MHKGTGLIIGNKAKDLFFIQKKDKDYQFKKWIDAFSFWGGEIEKRDNSPYDALIREIQEELTFQFDYEQIKFVDEFLVKSDEDYKFYLFELLVSDNLLQSMKGQKVNEGNCVLVKKELLLKNNWVWGLEQIIIQYFEDKYI